MQTEPLRVLDLFSGIGGFSLGLERAGMKPIAFCEIDTFCQAVLKKHWPNVPLFDDIRGLNATKLSGLGEINVISGGFPCQPYSVAGEQLGSEDDRALWPEYRRIIKELRPDWVIGENVIGLVWMELDTIITDLENLGYSVRTFDIPACCIGASHERRRIWIVAHAHGQGLEGSKEIGNAEIKRAWRNQLIAGFPSVQVWLDNNASQYGGSLNGIPRGVDRLRALGNAVVPQIPEIIGRAIIAATQ